MLRLVRVAKFGAAIVAASLMLAGVSTSSQAQTGTVRFKVVKAGFIVGAGGGSGSLIYNGQKYRLRIGGIGIGTIGIAEASFVGTAYNLHSPADIAGTYGAAGAGFAIVGGVKVARLQNEKGVVLEVRGVQTGFEVSIGLAGMTIALQ